MHKLIKLVTGGLAGLTLALALITGGSTNVAWNSGPAHSLAPAGIANGVQDGIANGVQDGIANRAFANPSPSVSYGPQR
jgi:hypothetical protein